MKLRLPRLAGAGFMTATQRGSVGTAEPGAPVPGRARGVGAVVAGDDVAESGCIAVQHRIEETDAVSQSLVQQRRKSGPERCHGAGTECGNRVSKKENRVRRGMCTHPSPLLWLGN